MSLTSIESQVSQQAVEFVRLGFHDASLYFRTSVNVPTFRECLWAAGGYNDFEPGRVSDALAPVLPECMGLEIGRECSPVIYLSVPYWTHQAIGTGTRGGGMGEPITEDEREAIAARIMLAGRKAGADENHVKITGHGKVGHVRLWWD